MGIIAGVLVAAIGAITGYKAFKIANALLKCHEETSMDAEAYTKMRSAPASSPDQLILLSDAICHGEVRTMDSYLADGNSQDQLDPDTYHRTTSSSRAEFAKKL